MAPVDSGAPTRRPRAQYCRAAIALVAGLAGLALTTPWASGEAWAQGKAGSGKKGSTSDAAKHDIAVYVEGSKATEVREKILATLPSGAHAVDPGDFKKELTKLGQKTPVGVPLTLSKSRGPVLGRFGKAAASSNAEAVVIGVVKPKKSGGQEVLILWVKASTNEPTVDTTIPLDGGEKDAIAKALDPELASMKTASDTPVEPPPAGDDKTKPDDGKGGGTGEAGKGDEKDTGDGWKRPKNTHGREILSVFAGFDLGGRFFSYHQGLTSNLRDYDLKAGGGFALAAGVYPLAFLKTPVVSGLGIIGDFRMQLGIGSETKNKTKVDTSWNRFDVGLRFRQPLAKQEKDGDKAVVLGLSGTFGRDAFTLTTKDPVLFPETPGVAYSFMRVGLDGEFPAGPIFLNAKLGYMGALSKGDVFDRFKNEDPSIGGIDVGGGVTVPIALGFEVRLTGEYIRWFYAFKSTPADTYIAGGALDQYYHLELGPAYVF